MSNKSLYKAKASKNDEFYTLYTDIEKEIEIYFKHDKNLFRDKTVLLPCDDPHKSNFTKYFVNNFKRFGLKKLISSSIIFTGEHGKLFVLTNQFNSEENFDGYLKGDGDFRSEEITKLRDETDFIITNPPFSLFREFISWIMDGDKKFLILGNKNAITYKEIFPLLKDNKIWLGYTSPKDFKQPKGVKKKQMAGLTRWFTNLDTPKHHELLDLRGNYYDPEKYPKYDNYDAIEVGKVNDIPCDYDGVMGIPISGLGKCANPQQFEIIGIAKRGPGDPALRSHTYTKEEYDNYSDLNASSTLWVDGKLKNTYPRILIRNKNPETPKELEYGRKKDK